MVFFIASYIIFLIIVSIRNFRWTFNAAIMLVSYNCSCSCYIIVNTINFNGGICPSAY